MLITTKNRLEYLRRELRAERISYGELAELQGLRDEIDPGDVELLEAAGAPEFEEERERLSFDGFGINGQDEYRTRIATFTDSGQAEKWGALFEAAPDVADALEWAIGQIEDDLDHDHQAALASARDALARARGQR